MTIIERNLITITAFYVKVKSTASSAYNKMGIGMSLRVGMDVEHFVADLNWVVKMDIRMLNKAGERIFPYFTPLTDEIRASTLDP